MRSLAVLGGAPAVERRIPINQPTLPSLDEIAGPLGEVLDSAQLTNHRFVRQLEEQVEERYGTKHAIAVSSCTSGLLLALQALEVTRPKVLLPSFTFPATAHIVKWNGLTPGLVDCDEDSFNISLESVMESLDDQTGAILAVPIFGNPVLGDRLQAMARKHGLPVIYDAAHALGARSRGKSISTFADVAVYSLAPTKLVAAGEGGIVVTDDDEIARRVRVGRNYGNPGDYDCEFPGLNARMSELHAVLALWGLERLEDAIDRRGELVAHYRELLSAVPGVGFQAIRREDRSTHNYFAVKLDPEVFGLDAAEVAVALRAENIESRRYFHPPIHRQRAYRDLDGKERLTTTDFVCDRVLCLPLYTHLRRSDVEIVARTMAEIQARAEEVRRVQREPIARTVGVAR